MASIESISESAPIDIEVNGAQGPRGRDAATTVVTGNTTAANDYQYNVTASAVITDPTGVSGKGYTVFVINGTATVGGVAYSTEGTVIRRYYKSGAWYSKVYKDSTAYATAAQGTDERVPTTAGLIAKFGTAKGSLGDGDKVAIFDSAAADAPKHSLWSVVKSTLKTYFDTIYAAVVHTHTLSAGATDVTITATNLNTLDDGTDNTLHFHNSDRARSNHTGTQLASTISDFAAAVAASAPNSVTSATTSDGTAALSLASATVSGLLTAGHIHGNLAGTLYTHVRTGEAVTKGDPVYVSGFHNGSSQPIVSKADASNPAKMPAIGVMDANYSANTSSANCVIAGNITDVNTNAFLVNAPVYVANGGGFSATVGTVPQQVGIVERSNASNGAFIVSSNKVISSADISDASTTPVYNESTELFEEVAAKYDENGQLSAADFVSNSGGAFGTYTEDGTAFAVLSPTSSPLAFRYSGRDYRINSPSTGSGVQWELPNLAGTFALTASPTGVPDKLTNGVVAGTLTINSTSFTFGTGSAAALKTALAIASADITDATSDGDANKEKLLKTNDEGSLIVTSLVTKGAILCNSYVSIYKDENDSSSISASNITATRAYESPDANGTLALTDNVNGIPDKLTDGTIAGTLTINSTSYAYGSGAAAAQIAALGLDARYWQPDMIRGLQLNLAADDLQYQGLTAIANNDTVSAWRAPNKPSTTTAEVVFSQATVGARPIYRTNIQNSLPGVFFDGTNDVMAANAALMSILGNNSRTVFVVCRPTALASGGAGSTWNRPQVFSNVGQFNGISVSPSASNNIFTAWDYDAAGVIKNVSTVAVAPNTTVLLTHKHEKGVSSLSLNQGAPVTTSVLRDCTNTTIMQLGSNGAGSGFYQGFIFEILMYSRTLSALEIAQVETYLKTKWAV
jgi:hypothetical protein